MKHKLKICVYAICKNEEAFVDRWVESMKEADLIVVTDTGSTDQTVEKLREKGVVVYQESIKPWRFDVARNISLGHVPDDVDVCVCTDLDEIFLPGWRGFLEEAWLSHPSFDNKNVRRQGKYLYNWSINPDGTPDVQFVYFKVHERHGFRWKCPVHEHIEYIGKEPLVTIYIDRMVLNHYPDAGKSRSSYLPLLEMAVAEDPDNDRMRYYLGREYMYQKRWQDCINTLKFYLNMKSAGWRDERCAAMRWIAKSYAETGEFRESYNWYFRAVAEQPMMREPYIEFARLCMVRKDWALMYSLVKEALKITEKSKTFVNTGYCWNYTPYDLCAISAYNLGLYKESYENAKIALEYEPSNERLKKNFKIIEDKYLNA